jgi:hypothetical protein
VESTFPACSAPISATADQWPLRFHDPDTLPPFRPKQPQSPGGVLLRTQWYESAASPPEDSCAIEAVAAASINTVASAIDRILNLLIRRKSI